MKVSVLLKATCVIQVLAIIAGATAPPTFAPTANNQFYFNSACSAQNPSICGVTCPDGNHNLMALLNNNDPNSQRVISFNSGGFDYQVTVPICAAGTNPSGFESLDIIQSDAFSTNSLGSLATGDWQVGTYNGQVALKAHFTGGTSCDSNGDRESQVYLVCDTACSVESPCTSASEPSTCRYDIVIRSVGVCNAPTTQPTRQPTAQPTTRQPSFRPTTASPSFRPTTALPTVSVKPSAPTVAPTKAMLRAYAWQSLSPEPVAADFPETEWLSDRPNTAIAFTGGGLTAYTAAMGILSALTELGLMDDVRYIGGISGGSWATMVYTYAQGIADFDLLPPIIRPENMTVGNLQAMNPLSALKVVKRKNNFAQELLLAAFRDSSRMAEDWCDIVGKMYLEPVNITSGTRFSWNQEVVDGIKARNPDLAGEKFLLPANTKRPFPLIGTTLVGPSSLLFYQNDNHNYTMLDITPLYIGQLKARDVLYKPTAEQPDDDTVIIPDKVVKHAGGAVETFAFARKGSAPLVGLENNQVMGTLSVPPPAEIFDLKHATGASSYAPATAFYAVTGILNPVGFFAGLDLKFDYWSPADPTPTATDTLFADGGNYENIPLINFLQRRVEKIALFINSGTPLDATYDPTDLVFDSSKFDGTVSAFFGVFPDPTTSGGNIATLLSDGRRNQVFSHDDYIIVVKALQAAQKVGNGIVSTHTLTTIKNDWWGIPAGIVTTITFNYMSRLSGWEAKLPADLFDEYINGDNFPNYNVIMHTLFNFADEDQDKKMPSLRANSMAALTGWSVLQHADTYKYLLSAQPSLFVASAESCSQDTSEGVVQCGSLKYPMYLATQVNAENGGDSVIFAGLDSSSHVIYEVLIPICSSRSAAPTLPLDFSASDAWQQNPQGSNELNRIGSLDASSWKVGQYDGQAAFQVAFTSGSSAGGCGVDRTSIVHLICDENRNSYVMEANEDPICVYNIRIYSKTVCDVQADISTRRMTSALTSIAALNASTPSVQQTVINRTPTHILAKQQQQTPLKKVAKKDNKITSNIKNASDKQMPGKV